MCTYLYAAFSMRSGEAEGLSPTEAVARWRQAIMRVAIEEMSHLAAVWNITSALGGAPRFGRGNFPLDAGLLPAGVVVKLAPFGPDVLQHFIFLERPTGSTEREGAGFAPDFAFTRGTTSHRLTSMAIDYETVGAFYATLGASLRAFVDAHGEAEAFCGDPALQLSPAESYLAGKPVICAKTALAAIVEQGEGAPSTSRTLTTHDSSRSAASSLPCARQTRPSWPRSPPRTTLCCAGRCGPRAACGSRMRPRRLPWISRTPDTR